MKLRTLLLPANAWTKQSPGRQVGYEPISVLLQAVAERRIGLTIILDHRAVWTPRDITSKIPRVVLISDGTEHSAKHIERKLREFAPSAEIHFELVAVTKEKIEQWELPTRETEREGNRHAKNFQGDSCELDAIPPDKLRALVRECITRHIDVKHLAAMEAAEASERDALQMFAQSWKSA